VGFQQALYVPAEGFVAFAGGLQEGGSFLGREVQRLRKRGVDLPPSIIGTLCHPSISNARYRYV
jgi:hypothetical protein